MLNDNIKSIISNKVAKRLNYSNVMQLPKIEKVCLNMGLGNIGSKHVLRCADILTLIAGQRACVVKCKKSVSAFKIRSGMDIGTKVTLRGKYAYYFLEKLIYIVFPLMRDFSGFSLKSINKDGNFAFGLKDLSTFPEISYDDLNSLPNKDVGMDVNIALRSNSTRDTYILLSELGFVFRDADNKY